MIRLLDGTGLFKAGLWIGTATGPRPMQEMQTLIRLGKIPKPAACFECLCAFDDLDWWTHRVKRNRHNVPSRLLENQLTQAARPTDSSRIHADVWNFRSCAGTSLI
ncbi:hypothetical protein OUZ56_015624 [Daphnia magna]|uniref:Uncharacterized protein n=1 Tax=Daphnia magna TaxID=35525 RepID=A0ABR0ANC5_9CRUS|nr:hypothetical protein OUZ56_015624 [Daphnia magna]